MDEPARTPDLSGHVAVVAGATRGAGRWIAVELGAAGATVYVTGRTTRTRSSPMGRSETIEGTAVLVSEHGGRGIAVPVDHSLSNEVARLVERVTEEQSGRLDVLVNDIWGGDPLTEWDTPFWEHSLENGLALLRQAVETHIVTSHHAAKLMVARRGGLIVEITDGASDRYRGNLFYDLAKASVIRLALAQAADLRPHGVAAVALTPGFLRSEAVLDHFGVAADDWRDAIAREPHFAASETPRYIGRAVAALAADHDVIRQSGQATSTWQLAKKYGFTDLDGTRPDWGAHIAEHFGEPA